MLTPERILLVMPNWFGEALFATPLLRVLRHAYPSAALAALGVPRCHDVLQQNPHLQEFITYEETGRHRTLRGKRQLIAQLRARRFDTAMILRRSLSRTLMLRLAGIPRRIGFDNRKSGWLLTDRVPVPAAPIHKAHGYLRLGAPLGLPPRNGTYEYWVSNAERTEAAATMQRLGLADGTPVVVLHPGANWPHKRWSPERFAQLATRLTESCPCRIVVTGGPDDLPLAQAISERTSARPVIIAGSTTLRQLAACLEYASLVVSNDTGILHIAVALGRPVVALYGPTSPALTGPLGDPRRTMVVHHSDCCPHIPCYRADHPGSPGMDSILVDEVYAAACRLLNQTRRSSQQSAVSARGGSAFGGSSQQ